MWIHRPNRSSTPFVSSGNTRVCSRISNTGKPTVLALPLIVVGDCWRGTSESYMYSSYTQEHCCCEWKTPSSSSSYVCLQIALLFVSAIHQALSGNPMSPLYFFCIQPYQRNVASNCRNQFLKFLHQLLTNKCTLQGGTQCRKRPILICTTIS